MFLDSTGLAGIAGARRTLCSLSGDIDGDGTLDTGIQFTVTGPPAGPSGEPEGEYYDVELWRADAQGSSGSMTGYTLAKKRTVKAETYATSLDTLIQIECSTGKWWKVRVRAASWNGVNGAWSTFQNLGFQPSGYSNTMPTVAWQGSNPIVAKPKAIWLRFVQITLASFPQAKEIVVYRNTSNNSATATEIGTAAPGAQRYQDNDDLTPGTTYYYWLKVRDRQNAVSASFSAVQSVPWRVASAVASDGDFDTTALAAPACTNSSAATVANACYIVQENQDVNGDGKVDLAVSVHFQAVTNAGDYEIEVSQASSSGGPWTVTGKGGITNGLVWSFIVNTSKFYKARVRARNVYAQPGAWTANVVVLSTTTAFSSYSGFQPLKKPSYTSACAGNVNAIGGGVECFMSVYTPEDDYHHTEFYIMTAAGPPSPSVLPLASSSGGARAVISSQQNYPNWAPGTTVNCYYRNVDNSLNRTAWAACSSSPVIITGTDGSFIANGTIGTLELGPNVVTYPKLDSAVFNNGISAMSLGALGTYALLKKTNTGTSTPGDTVSGSNLVYTDTGLSSGSNPSGTWMAMGRCPQNQATQWLRVS